MSTDRKISSISIIIPTRNEVENISRFLPELLSNRGLEVLVVDGGSTDNTVATAKALGAQAFRSPPGRACQMNAGARAAKSEILLFLHADTRLPPNFREKVHQTLLRPDVAAGAFRLAIDGDGIGLRMVERLANFRARILQLPYGDQGIFVRADTFSAVGGFPDLPIMEDFALVRKLQRRGCIKILKPAATTSSRRWRKLGILRATLINQAIIMGYLLGVAPQKLAIWYRRRREN